jgi:hypothetical protein
MDSPVVLTVEKLHGYLNRLANDVQVWVNDEPVVEVEMIDGNRDEFSCCGAKAAPIDSVQTRGRALPPERRTTEMFDDDDDIPADWDEDREHWHTCVHCGMRYLCDLRDHPTRDGQSLDLDGCEACPRRGPRGLDTGWRRLRIRL